MVRDIERDRVTLRRGDEVETLALRADLTAPFKPARATGKRKRGERAAEREANAAPDAAAETEAKSP
jgi:hypothetical protein